MDSAGSCGKKAVLFSKDTGKPLRHFSLWRDTLRSAFGKIHSIVSVDNGREEPDWTGERS